MLRWLFPVVGCLSLLWYLIRVVPKPSRASYPCQRVAGPLASGFVSWLLGWMLMFVAWNKARGQRRGGFALVALCVVGMIVGLVLSLRSDPVHAFSFTANSPVGTGRGIFPGRVVWTYEPDATTWDGATGYWWQDAYTSQTAVDNMLSQTLRTLTGTTNDFATWDALFRSYNQTHGRGNVGYQAGEPIAIKINLVNTMLNDPSTPSVNANPSPQMVFSLLKQLVNTAGVAQNMITIFDAVRTFPDDILNECYFTFPNIIYMDKTGGGVRTAASFVPNSIAFSVPNACTPDVVACLINATYVINMSELKCHSYAGVTLTAKNHYGSLYQSEPFVDRDHDYIRGNYGYPSYNPFVDLIGHKSIGGKTVLFMIDALYGAPCEYQCPPTPFQMAPFNNHWTSSLLASQDPLAIDSVGLDILSTEFPNLIGGCTPWPDNYLREAALAPNSPSGVHYTPNGDGVWLTSLGVHEHWNNATQRQYSRNLGATNGIELVSLFLNTTAAPPTQFVMDGAADSAGYKIGTNTTGTATLFAAVHGTTLYVAAPTPGYVTSPTTTGEDHFILVTDTLAPLGPAPWQKLGQVAFSLSKPFLAEDGYTKTPRWTNTTTTARCTTAATTAGYMEGTIDLVGTFGYLPPVVYIAYAAYVWDNPSHGALIPSSQIPAAGNNDGNINSNEFLAVPTSAITDSTLAGLFDIVNPSLRFNAAVSASAAGDIITWPTVPAHTYELHTNTGFTLPFTPLATNLVASPGQFTMTFTNPPGTNATQRFYRIKHVGP